MGGSDGLGSLRAWGPLFLLMGIGWGRTCLGKPLKNQAPERFHTWGCRKWGGTRVGGGCWVQTRQPSSPCHRGLPPADNTEDVNPLQHPTAHPVH